MYMMPRNVGKIVTRGAPPPAPRMENLRKNPDKKVAKKRGGNSKKSRSVRAKNQTRNEQGKFAQERSFFAPVQHLIRPKSYLVRNDEKAKNYAPSGGEKTAPQSRKKSRKNVPISERTFGQKVVAVLNGKFQKMQRRQARRHAQILRQVRRL
jgi:hypothetical protein